MAVASRALSIGLLPLAILASVEARADPSSAEGAWCQTSQECGGLKCVRERCHVMDWKHDRIVPPRFDPAPARYLGASVSAFAGSWFENHNVVAYGGDFYTGLRVWRRWLSVELFYSYDIEDGAVPPTPAFCPRRPADTWIGDSYRWQTLGLRTWFHLLRTRAVDVSIAPTTAGGFLLDRTSYYCRGTGDITLRGPDFEAGLAFGLAWRLRASFGVRVSVEALIDVGVYAFALRASVGPVVWF